MSAERLWCYIIAGLLSSSLENKLSDFLVSVKERILCNEDLK